MKVWKVIAALASAVFFPGFGLAAHAEGRTLVQRIVSREPASLIPLGIFIAAAVFVFLSNRPRKVMIYARARRTRKH